MAMAYALEALGKEVRLVNSDPAPEHYMEFPGVDRIEIAREFLERDADALIVMESSDLKRTGVAGLEGRFTINIDHHQGNTSYGDLNWLDESAAACGELVFELIRSMGVPLTLEIATHIYLAILTDTGSFHHSNITPKTFEICRDTVAAGVNPTTMARRVFDSNSFGKLKLIGALLDDMELLDDGRLAVLHLNDVVLNATGTTYNDTEGLINLPLTAREIQAVAFFKVGADGDIRVSLRSKYDVDVRTIASRHGGGGHKNAAGFTVRGPLDEVRSGILQEIEQAIAAGMESRPQD
jgi:bifunctional oligoribonuclease and PAP phosphatase NrnA